VCGTYLYMVYIQNTNHTHTIVYDVHVVVLTSLTTVLHLAFLLQHYDIDDCLEDNAEDY